MAPKSRAEYFKSRRKSTKAFYVELDVHKMEQLEIQLKEKNTTKKEWLEKKVDEELGK